MVSKILVNPVSHQESLCILHHTSSPVLCSVMRSNNDRILVHYSCIQYDPYGPSKHWTSYSQSRCPWVWCGDIKKHASPGLCSLAWKPISVRERRNIFECMLSHQIQIMLCWWRDEWRMDQWDRDEWVSEWVSEEVSESVSQWVSEWVSGEWVSEWVSGREGQGG